MFTWLRDFALAVIRWVTVFSVEKAMAGQSHRKCQLLVKKEQTQILSSVLVGEILNK